MTVWILGGAAALTMQLVQRLVVLADGDFVDVADLPEDLAGDGRALEVQSGTAAASCSGSFTGTGRFPSTLWIHPERVTPRIMSSVMRAE